MTDSNPSYNINDFLEPVNIDLDKLFSLSYTFDNLKAFMQHMINNQKKIADKINDLEKNLTKQKEENKKNQQYQTNVERRLKLIEVNTSKAKKEMQNMKKKQEEEQKKKETDNKEKDVTDEKDIKKYKKESNEDSINNEIINKISEKKLARYKISDKENDLSYEDEYSNLYAPNHEIQEIKEKLDNLEKSLEKMKLEKNNLLFKPNEFLMDDKKGEIDMMKLEIKTLNNKSESFKAESDIMKKKWKKYQ